MKSESMNERIHFYTLQDLLFGCLKSRKNGEPKSIGHVKGGSDPG